VNWRVCLFVCLFVCLLFHSFVTLVVMSRFSKSKSLIFLKFARDVQHLYQISAFKVKVQAQKGVIEHYQLDCCLT